jgi:hypothetical protein
MKRLLAAVTAATVIALMPASASAQKQAGDRVNTVIIFGEDPCPQSTAEEITVCARLDESERFRIPESLRGGSSPASESWTSRVRSYETVGNFGPLSCSPFGAGAELGCTAEMIEAAFAQRAQGSNVRFSQLIEAAREERLAGIDAEAAATQARVEEIERQTFERIRREQDAAEAGQAVPAPPAVQIVDPARLPPPPSQ